MKKQDKNKEKPNNIKTTSIPGLLIIERPTFSDMRGFFRETLRLDELRDFIGWDFQPKQWNHSHSMPGVIRGLHAENWNKVIYPITGKMVSYYVDIRPDSETFSKVEKIEFDEKEPKAVFIQKGVANSICVTGESPVHYLYLVDSYYTGEDTTAVDLNDPDLNIDWPVEKPVISERDKNNPRLRDLFPHKFKK